MRGAAVLELFVVVAIEILESYLHQLDWRLGFEGIGDGSKPYYYNTQYSRVRDDAREQIPDGLPWAISEIPTLVKGADEEGIVKLAEQYE